MASPLQQFSKDARTFRSQQRATRKAKAREQRAIIEQGAVPESIGQYGYTDDELLELERHLAVNLIKKSGSEEQIRRFARAITDTVMSDPNPTGITFRFAAGMYRPEVDAPTETYAAFELAKDLARAVIAEAYRRSPRVAQSH